MAKKGEILFWLFIIGMYAFAFTMSPLMSYTSFLRSALPGHQPDPDNVELASKIEMGYFGGAGAYFAFVIIFWTFSYFQTWKLANRYPRLNIKLVFEPRYSKLHLGMGIVAVKEIKGSSMDVENALRSGGLQTAFNEIKAEIEQKFHGKRAVESTEPKEKPKDKKERQKEKIEYTIDDLKKEDINFASFPIELLQKQDWEYFFDKIEIDFFKTIGLKDTNDFLKKTYAELDIIKAKYYNQFKKHRDLAATQIIMKKSLEFLNKEQIEFLKAMNVTNIQELLDANIDQLNAKYNDKFIKPKVKFLDKFVEALKLVTGDSDLTKKIDFKALIKFIVEDLIAKEKAFAIEMDRADYVKYLYLKIVKCKAQFPDKHGYLITFDTPFLIPAATPEYDFYKERDIEEVKRDKDNTEEELDKFDVVPVKTALILTHAALSECFMYHPGEVDDFGGHQVDCNMITDAVCRYRGMLTANICVIELRSSDWSINFSALATTDWTRDEEYNIMMATMLQLQRDRELVTEDLKKALETERARVDKKENELDKMWAKKWADTTPEQATRRLLTVQPKPLNAYIAVLFVVIAIVFTVLGLLLGIFLSPWLGAYFGVQTGSTAHNFAPVIAGLIKNWIPIL